MTYLPSAFRSDRARLTFLDILRLLVGLEVRSSSLILGLWRMPKCDCPNRSHRHPPLGLPPTL